MHIHRYGKWEDGETVKYFDPVFGGSERPVSKKLVQTKICHICGKKKSRRVRVW